MGGSLTLWTALQQPSVSGIVLINPASQPQAEEMLEMVKGLLAEGTEVFPGIGSDIADPEVKESSYPETPLAPLVSMVEDGIRPMLSQYGSCKIPMLLITSKNDHVVDPATSDELAAQWGGSVERILLDRSFHVATQDYDKDFINESALAFAAKVTA
jgi:carboxylesterase